MARKSGMEGTVHPCYAWMVRVLCLVLGLTSGALVAAPGARHVDEVGGAVCDAGTEPERSSPQLTTVARKPAVRASATRLPPLARAPGVRPAPGRASGRLPPTVTAPARLKPDQHLVAAAPPRGPPRTRA